MKCWSPGFSASIQVHQERVCGPVQLLMLSSAQQDELSIAGIADQVVTQQEIVKN